MPFRGLSEPGLDSGLPPPELPVLDVDEDPTSSIPPIPFRAEERGKGLADAELRLDTAALPRGEADVFRAEQELAQQVARAMQPAAAGPDIPNFTPRRTRIPPSDDSWAAAGYHRYDERTNTLLAHYFADSISVNERRELGALLAFPGNQRAQSLLTVQSVQKLTPDEEGELSAHAAFPLNSRAAMLAFRAGNPGASLTPSERLELYCYRVFSGDQALERHRELGKILAPVLDGKASAQLVSTLLVQLARAELTAGREVATPAAELGKLFGRSETEVRALLADPAHGLGASELAIRAERIELAGERSRHGVVVMRAHALRNLLYLENEFHRFGAIEKLSSAARLSELFGTGDATTGKLIRLLPSTEYHYRERQLGRSDAFQAKRLMVEAVKREIAALQGARVSNLRSDAELAAAFGIAPITVFHTLHRHLPPAELDLREYALRGAHAAQEHRKDAVSFVRAEIAAFRKGEINALLSVEELATFFRVDVSTIRGEIRDAERGVALEDRKLRHFVLSVQRSQGAALNAMRQVSAMGVKESVEKHLAKILPADSKPTEAPDKKPDFVKDVRPRGKTVFRGVKYDSMEEAACSVLLAKYVPDFVPLEGRTVQFDTGQRFIDFVFRNLAIEYHPILPFYAPSGVGAFKTFAEYEHFNRAKMLIKTNDRRALFVEEVKAQLFREYRDERQRIVDEHPQLRGRELIVAVSPLDFYYAVIKRFAEHPPSEKLFLREFNRAKARIRKENQG